MMSVIYKRIMVLSPGESQCLKSAVLLKYKEENSYFSQNTFLKDLRLQCLCVTRHNVSFAVHFSILNSFLYFS